MIAIRALVILAACFLAATTTIQVEAQSSIGGDLASTARIVAKLCLCSNRDPTIAQRFFDCYDVAPGKNLFVKCQMEVNGYILNTQENIRKSCRSLITFPRVSFQSGSHLLIGHKCTQEPINQCQ